MKFDFQGIEWHDNVPKYQQIADYITSLIDNQALPDGYRLPSVNSLSRLYSVSRDTAERVYETLKQQGRVRSIRRFGLFVNRPSKAVSPTALSILVLAPRFDTAHQQFCRALDQGLEAKGLLFFRTYSTQPLGTLIDPTDSSFDRYVILTPYPEELTTIMQNAYAQFLNKVFVVQSKLSASDAVHTTVHRGLQREVLRDGLTVVSMDAQLMGTTVASLLLTQPIYHEGS